MIVFHFLIGFWWYSSEYFFIDIHENLFDEFFISDKDLIIKYVKGQASILEKIKIKFSLKEIYGLLFLWGLFLY